MKSKFIHPDSRFKIAWEIYILFITIIITIVAPLMVVFKLHSSVPYLVFEMLVTISFMGDIFVQFNTAYMVRRELVTDKRVIASKYLKGWFVFDLLAALPFSWLMWFSRLGSLNHVLRFSRLSRLLKLFGGAKVLKRARNQWILNPAFLRLIFLVFWILLAAHLIACGWIFIGGTGQDILNRGETYLNAFYWTVTTLTTIGYGDIVPTGSLQTAYVILIELMGAALYGFIIGNIANIIANIDVAKSRFKKKVEMLDTFLKYRNIPSNLQRRIHDYFDYTWESRRGYEESALLRDLPDSLKTQVSFFLNKDIIEKVPLFQIASEAFVRDIILNLKPTIYTPEDAIITFGEIGYEMYFISRGTVAVTNESGSVVYATLSSGQFFGEIALLLSTPRTATVIAKEYCDLYVLDKETFDQILQRYPNFAKTVEEEAERRRRELGLETSEDNTVDENPLQAPQNLVYRVLTDEMVELSWDAVEGADGYEIVRRITGEEPWQRLVKNLSETIFLDRNAPSGSIIYLVRGVKARVPGRWSAVRTIHLAG